jgi:mono/diheme cytochrome c family protein
MVRGIVILATVLSSAVAAVDRGAARNADSLSWPGLQTQDAAQTTTRTVWSGAYTDAQAARGEALYRANCSRCHNEGPRRGEAFMRDWSGSDVGSFFARTKASMPAGAPGSLTDAEYFDIIAYMLRVNDFPAGREELGPETAGSIRVEGRNGPEPVPSFALVRVVGCLTAGPGSDWTVTNGSEPARTRNPAASTGDELKGSEATALGTATFRLMNVYPRPEAYTGHKVEAKGFLIRDPNGDRLNATAVQSLAPRCETAVP